MCLTFVFFLVNNAGFVYGVEKVGDIAEADIDAMFGTNVLGLIAITQILVRREAPYIVYSTCPYSFMIDFKERNAGHVINLGSIAGIETYAGGSIYCATKHACVPFFPSRNSTARRDVCNSVLPF